MKICLLTSIFGLLVINGFSQNNHMPPKNVSQTFYQEYPHSQPSQWSQSSVGWSVLFKDNDHNNGEVMAYFDLSGRHVDTHIPYENQDVPQTVRSHMNDQYGGNHYDYTRIDHRGEYDVYRTQYKHKKQYKTVYMDHDGHERDYHDMHN